MKSVEQLSRALALERKRTARIYALANRIVNQRSEVEEFFISALEKVRNEISTTQYVNYDYYLMQCCEKFKTLSLP